MSKRADRSVIAPIHVDDLDFPVGAVRGWRVWSTVFRIVLMPAVVFVKSPHDHDKAARVCLKISLRIKIWVVGGHTGTGFQYSGFRESWNQVPVFDNFSESWEIVPLFGEIPNTGTKFQYDALAQ